MSWLLKALPYLVAVALGVAWTAVAYHLGSKAREDAVRLAWQTERTANARAVANAIERTLDAERELGDILAARDQQHQKEMTMSPLNSIALLSSCALALCGCQSLPSPDLAPAGPPALQIPPLPAQLQKREPNLTQRLRQLWHESPATVTRPSSISTPASIATTRSAPKATH